MSLYAFHVVIPRAAIATYQMVVPPISIDSMYIHNTDLEAMRDDGAVLEAELNDIGVPVKRDVQIGYPHYFWCFPVKKGGAAFRDLLVNGFGWVLDQNKPRRSAMI